MFVNSTLSKRSTKQQPVEWLRFTFNKSQDCLFAEHSTGRFLKRLNEDIYIIQQDNLRRTIQSAEKTTKINQKCRKLAVKKYQQTDIPIKNKDWNAPNKDNKWNEKQISTRPTVDCIISHPNLWLKVMRILDKKMHMMGTSREKELIKLSNETGFYYHKEGNGRPTKHSKEQQRALTLKKMVSK